MIAHRHVALAILRARTGLIEGTPAVTSSSLSRTRLLGALAVVALAMVASLPAAATTHPPAATTPTCTTAGLVVWLDTSAGGGAAGSTYYSLDFTNLSGHRCTLQGFPGISALDLGGRQLGRAASRNTTGKVRVVSLANDASDAVTLQIVEAGNFPASSCHLVTAAGLRVFPPNQRAAKVVPFPFAACSRSGPVYLTVHAA